MVEFLPEAKGEFLDAYRWYEEKRPGLGEEFRAEIEENLYRIMENPRSYVEKVKGIRQARLQRFFPYSIYFELVKDNVIVYSVFHASRNPKIISERSQGHE